MAKQAARVQPNMVGRVGGGPSDDAIVKVALDYGDQERGKQPGMKGCFRRHGP